MLKGSFRTVRRAVVEMWHPAHWRTAGRRDCNLYLLPASIQRPSVRDRRSDQAPDASNMTVIAANAGDRDANHAKHLQLDRAGARQSA